MHGRTSTIRADQLFRARLCMDMALLVVCFRGFLRARVVASSAAVLGDTWPVRTIRCGRLYDLCHKQPRGPSRVPESAGALARPPYLDPRQRAVTARDDADGD